jgi:predicted glycosyltransferase
LEQEGVHVLVTAKPHAHTLHLAERWDLEVIAIGRPNPRHWLYKAAVTLRRVVGLTSGLRRLPRPDLMLSHGSRSGVLAARLLGISAWTFLDYEHVEVRSLAAGTTVFWMPDLLQDATLRRELRSRVRFYPGLKENFYLSESETDRESIRAEFGIRPQDRWVVTRPPAMSAHYRSERSWDLWLLAIRRLLERRDVRIDVIPRDTAQGSWIQKEFNRNSALRVVTSTVDGPAVIASADLVVGGGGTMNREAAVLGTPVWSVFSGATPHIDNCLASEGRLLWIRASDDLMAAEQTLWTRPEARGGGLEGRRLVLRSILQAVSRKAPRAATAAL